MGNFVYHRYLDLLLQFVFAFAHSLKGFLKEEYGVGKQRRGRDRPFRQGNALKKAQEILRVIKDVGTCFPGGTFLDRDNHIIQILANLFGNTFNRPFHQAIELPIADLDHIHSL